MLEDDESGALRLVTIEYLLRKMWEEVFLHKKFNLKRWGLLSAYKTAEGDHPTIGIILCTDKSETVVKYATTRLDHDLFVSKYLVELPKEEELRVLIERDRFFLQEKY